MEDVLDLYHEACDPERPVVGFDETSRQLVEDVRPPIKAKPGRVERYDTEYQRKRDPETCSCSVNRRADGGHVEVTERRTAVDFAHQMRWLVDQAYPHARVVRLVLDNLNTHKLGLALRSIWSVRSASYSQAPGVSPHSPPMEAG